MCQDQNTYNLLIWVMFLSTILNKFQILFKRACCQLFLLFGCYLWMWLTILCSPTLSSILLTCRTDRKRELIPRVNFTIIYQVQLCLAKPKIIYYLVIPTSRINIFNEHLSTFKKLHRYRVILFKSTYGIWSAFNLLSANFT